MDTSQLKRYATQARRDVRDAVSARAKRIGVNEGNIQRYAERGDLLIIGEQTFPGECKQAFDALYSEVGTRGFEALVDEAAYTWFNRFVALRFMELHDYFPHGLRVLSSTDEDPTPQILRNPLQLHFSYGFNKAKAHELFDAGNKEEELYRMVLIAQCNELNTIMPFLFERVSDLSELLLPDNLLASDSIIRKLASEIEESAWFEGVEIIGWIYQYYISEKKDEVIGKVVKSEDIPAATQLFTPNWIVKYLVQNSVGAYWLGTYPDSPLAEKMEYYIKPAEQDASVLEELKKITPSEIDPESITVLDPACGSGHILVEAYDVLKEIYLERGYRPREIPRLILEKNLFGLDIDGRAAQLASFALLMKARADDTSIFSAGHPVKLNIVEIVEADFNIDEAVEVLTKGKDVSIEQTELPLTTDGSLTPSELREFLELFKEAKTFGSLITVPEELKPKIAVIERLAGKRARGGHSAWDWFGSIDGKRVLRICEQAKVLSGVFDAVVANPPYMGGKFFNPPLKKFITSNYPLGKSDLYAAFIQKSLELASAGRFASVVTMQSWMFLSSVEDLRTNLLGSTTIRTLLHMGNNVMRIAFGTTACIFQKHRLPDYKGAYTHLEEADCNAHGLPKSFPASNMRNSGVANRDFLFLNSSQDFSAIPGSPIAYWTRSFSIFRLPKLADYCQSGGRIKTHDGSRFLRFWWEPARTSKRWRLIVKGGDFRKHAGNEEYVVDWSEEARSFYESHGGLYSEKFIAKEGICCSKITSSFQSFRIKRSHSEYDSAAPTIFTPTMRCDFALLGFLNSVVARYLLNILNPTLNTQVRDILALPYPPAHFNSKLVEENERKAVEISLNDWNCYETAFDFVTNPLLSSVEAGELSIKKSYNACAAMTAATRFEMQRIETVINNEFINSYGLADELQATVPLSEITLHKSEAKSEIVYLIAFVTGCMMGRYSLDTPGLIYANSGNIGFDPSRYKKFPADADGVVPILDHPWFADDITTRFQEFLIACWGKDTLEENMKFVADSLEPKQGETPEETIRRYFCDTFFKNHLKMYKKRPIYWLFSSGKEKAFQALVYLHRYNEQTLSQMRTEYVLPLQGKMSNEERRLDAQIDTATTPAERNRFKKELEKLKKKQVELRKFDELLHHYADKRISLDLDDGVKVNYGKFGALLAEVKQVTGGSEE